MEETTMATTDYEGPQPGPEYERRGMTGTTGTLTVGGIPARVSVIAIPARVSVIDDAHQRVQHAIARLENVLEQAQVQLRPILHEGSAPKMAEDDEVPMSPLVNESRQHARQLNRIAENFTELLDCLDV